MTVVLLFLNITSAYATVKVVESSPSRLVLSWELLGFDTLSVLDGETRRVRLSFDGGYIAASEAGGAELPGYPFYVGVPAHGDVRVSLEPEETAVFRTGAPLSLSTRRDGQALSFSSSAWVSDPSYEYLRDLRAAYFAVRPVIDAGAAGVRLLRRARIIIEFPSASHSGAAREPKNEYDRMVKRLLLNHGVAQGWQTAPRAQRKSSAEDERYPIGSDRKAAKFKVGDGYSGGNETSTNENTLAKISGKRINELFGGAGRVRITDVALFASHRGELDLTPSNDGVVPHGIFEVPLMRYDLNGDGLTDQEDYFVAYLSGASDWKFDAELGEYAMDINRYDDYRTYWLYVKETPGLSMGKYVQPVFNSGEPVITADYFEDNVYLRTPQSIAYDVNSGRASGGGLDWAWTRLSMSRPDTVITLDTRGADLVRDAAAARFFTARYPNTAVNAFYGADTVCAECVSGQWYPFKPSAGGNRNLAIGMFYRSAVTSSNRSRIFAEINGIHYRYARKLSLSQTGGRIEVFSPTDSGGVRYALSLADAAGQLVYIVRIPDDGAAVSLVDTVRADVSFTDHSGIGVRYMVMAEKNIVDYSDSLDMVAVRPRQLADKYLTRDLWGQNSAGDYLIVTHPEFLDASQKLAEHKANMGMEPKIALVTDVMDQFGGGNTDPVALRNFLLNVYQNWQGGKDLSYVVLVGAGHYDYKGISSRTVNFMPIMYINRHFGDDYYVFLDSMHPSMQHAGYYFIGRFPVRSSTDAFDIVGKIIEMEDPQQADFTSWRNRVLMTADDDQQGAGGDNIPHYDSSEKSAAIIEANRSDADIRKLYMFEYPWDETYSKPGAKRAFINEINSGVSVVSWFGHGSMNQIADEAIFTKADVSVLYNKKRYPLFSMFSCSINKFDQPNDECLGAALVKQPGSGGIVSVSSTRDVLASQNELLALPFFDALFSDTANLSVGAALREAKFRYNRTADNRYYVLLGDPSITFSPRNLKIDQLGVTNASGGRIDTLKALQEITVKGSIVPAAAKRAADIDGAGTFVSLTLFNPPEDSARRKDGGRYSNPVYRLPGSPVFSANVPVTNGKFEHKVLLPMNLAFGKAGVKLIAYAWKEGHALAGSAAAKGLIFEGSESGIANDTVPPKISVRPVYDQKSDTLMNTAGVFVKNRVTSQLPLTIEIFIEDENGINAIGTGPDEGLTMEVKGALSKRGINHLFNYDPGNYRQGRAAVTFEKNALKGGAHELIISAQDLLGNVARQSFVLDIVESAEIKLDHVLNIPNPVRMGRPTRFYYHHSNTPGDFDVNVTIRVYSLGGRLLAVIRNPRNGQEWLPSDQRGNLLSPNVYLYQITASTPNLGKTVKSKIKKLVVHPPHPKK